MAVRSFRQTIKIQTDVCWRVERAPSLCFSTRSLKHGVPQAPPTPPQPTACLNNAIPISTPILHSNSCLLVFPSPSLFWLCGILHGWKTLPCWLRPPRCLNMEEQSLLFQVGVSKAVRASSHWRTASEPGLELNNWKGNNTHLSAAT